MSSNEQTTVAGEDRIRAQQAVFAQHLAEFLVTLKSDATLEAKRHEFLNVIREATEFANVCEQTVDDARLLGAYKDPDWGRSKAETSLNALDTILQSHATLVAIAHDLELPSEATRASPTAYASMQRLVSLFFPERIDPMRRAFEDAGLPVVGFDDAAPLSQSRLALRSLRAKWRHLRTQVSEQVAKSPDSFVPSSAVAQNVIPLESEGARLIETYAPWMSDQWLGCAFHRRPQAGHGHRGLLPDEIPLLALLGECDERLAILDPLDDAIVKAEVHAASSSADFYHVRVRLDGDHVALANDLTLERLIADVATPLRAGKVVRIDGHAVTKRAPQIKITRTTRDAGAFARDHEQRMKRTGRWDFSIDVRTLPTEHGEDVTVRFLPPTDESDAVSNKGNSLESRVAVVLTALPVEYKAVRAFLANVTEEEHDAGTIYERGELSAESGDWTIYLVEVGAGNQRAAIEAERAIATYSPSVALFVGVGGGVKDVSLGDVVVATKIYGYESGRETDEGFLPRPDVGQVSYRLEQRARAESKRDDWKTWARRVLSDLEVDQIAAIVAPIAAGEKVVASRRSATFTFLRREYSDAVAVEMEGRGFLTATHANNQHSLVVRGISDLIEKKEVADAGDWQPRAAKHAAAFAMHLLTKLRGATKSIRDDVSPIKPSELDELRAQQLRDELRLNIEIRKNGTATFGTGFSAKWLVTNKGARACRVTNVYFEFETTPAFDEYAFQRGLGRPGPFVLRFPDQPVVHQIPATLSPNERLDLALNSTPEVVRDVLRRANAQLPDGFSPDWIVPIMHCTVVGADDVAREFSDKLRLV